MKYTKSLAGIGIIVFGLIIAIFFAGFIGEVLGKAAKASSAKIKLEQQNAQSSTQNIIDRIRQASQQNEANQAVSNITYFSDPRTSLCFAYLNVYDSYGATRSITTVNCGLVPRNLLIVAIVSPK